MTNEQETTTWEFDKPGQPPVRAKTLRDEFAMAAMHALMANPQFAAHMANEVPSTAYAMADAMMKARDAS